MPGDSKCPLHPLVGGHLTPWKGHLTILKRSLWITRFMFRFLGSFFCYPWFAKLKDHIFQPKCGTTPSPGKKQQAPETWFEDGLGLDGCVDWGGRTHVTPDQKKGTVRYCLGGLGNDVYVFITLPETKIAPENGWLEDDRFLMFPLGMASFLQVRTVGFRESKSFVIRWVDGMR